MQDGTKKLVQSQQTMNFIQLLLICAPGGNVQYAPLCTSPSVWVVFSTLDASNSCPYASSFILEPSAKQGTLSPN